MLQVVGTRQDTADVNNIPCDCRRDSATQPAASQPVDPFDPARPKYYYSAASGSLTQQNQTSGMLAKKQGFVTMR